MKKPEREHGLVKKIHNMEPVGYIHLKNNQNKKSNLQKYLNTSWIKGRKIKF